MTHEEKFQKAQRVLSNLPKRANEMSREELIEIVDQIQIILYAPGTTEDGTQDVWDPDTDTDAADFLDSVHTIMCANGLNVDSEFEGQPVLTLAEIRARKADSR